MDSLQGFSEYCHAAYQIKGNEAYNNMLVNVLPLRTPLTSVEGSKGHFLFFESCQVACQVNGNEAENTMQANSLP